MIYVKYKFLAHIFDIHFHSCVLFLESDTSSNPITTDKDEDASTEKSTFPGIRNGNYQSG